MGETLNKIIHAAPALLVGGVCLFSLFSVISYSLVRWPRIVNFFKRYVFRKTSYDYTKIFKHYLGHIGSIIEDRRKLYSAILHVVLRVVESEDASLLMKDNGEYVIKESLGSEPTMFRVEDIEPFLNWLTKYRRTITRAELLNRKDLLRIKGDGLEFCVQFHAEAIIPLFLNGKLVGVINVGQRKSGEIYDRITRELLDILAGQFVVAIHNASLYEDLAEKNVQLEEATRLKSKIIANISHELRTPLTSIIGWADLMAEGGDGPITAEQREHALMMRTAGERLLNTVNSMMDLAKLEANHLALNVRKLSIKRLVHSVVERVEKKSGVTLMVDLTDDASVYGDEPWLKELLKNLLTNAVKFTAQGEILIDADRVGEMLRIGIHDTGIGIPKERQGTIFDGFTFSEDESIRHRSEVGLGLAISKKVVEIHGGRIWLKSEPGRGSHFYFTLPVKPTAVRCMQL